MLNMGNGLSTGAECYDCIRETVLVFEELVKLQQLATDTNTSEDQIEAVGNAFQRRAEALVIRLAENFGVTVDNSHDPMSQAEPNEIVR